MLYLIISVGKIFKVTIKFNDNNNLNNGFKLLVSSTNELSNNVVSTNRNLSLKARNYFNVSYLNQDEKSRYKIYLKLTAFFENAIENFLKLSNYKQKGLLLFTVKNCNRRIGYPNIIIYSKRSAISAIN
jgi:hypothetical protein